ncbi:helix-turn-helix domain-containing protein [Flavobacterium lindanitolerans]|uniref:AraC family transcriptional regulator n=1 Tax=Flavobacterium lindanitolerans TaxID=428988 RepID=UPI0011FA9970|nr:helix-turn-helix domain-containing protein [Flavobacterium lindanitolerans]MDQ7960900.1 helix-turn-helix domain-containing protein [Flavobacterium lindanitolerans]THD31869.1 MAG: AraC family transcriptional regulator [Flavobacterium johnsoniae]
MHHQLLPITPVLDRYIANASYFRQGADDYCEFKMVPRLFSVLFFVIEKKQSLEMSYGGGNYTFSPNSLYAFGVGNLPAAFQVTSEIEVILVQMHPGISCLFHNDDAYISTNQRFDISDTDQSIKDLNEKLAYANSIILKWQFIQEYLIKKFRSNFPEKYGAVAKAVDILRKKSGHFPVKSLSEQVFTSHRNLNYLFMEYIGFSPKKYADIIRFNSFVNLYMQKPEFLSDIALQCGYHDLSHLNKDFMRYMGTSPSDYFENFSSDVNNWCELDYLKP